MQAEAPGLHPSRLASLAPQDEVHRVSFAVPAAHFLFAPEPGHATARKLPRKKEKGAERRQALTHY